MAGLPVLAGAALMIRSWRAELPDPIASHWGADGAVNGYASVDAVVHVMLIGGSALALVFGAITWWLGQSSPTRRVGAAGTISSALFVSTLTVGSLNLQRAPLNAITRTPSMPPRLTGVGVGIALRRGESLLVERMGGRSLAVTVDGAARRLAWSTRWPTAHAAGSCRALLACAHPPDQVACRQRSEA